MYNEFNSSEKILRYMNKLDYFFNRSKTLIVAELDLTNRCNNACPGCCGVKENGAELNSLQIDKIVESLAEIDCKGVILSGGGEPLLSTHFSYAIKGLRENGISVGVNSNGLALDKEKAEIILRYCDYFRVSLDAATPETYKKTHGMPAQSFEKVLENCRNFAKLKKEIGSVTGFGIGFLTSEETVAELERFVLLCKEIGADFSQFRPFTGDLTNILEQYDELREKYETDRFFVKASLQKYQEMGKSTERIYTKCRGMYFSTVITADAKVFACLHYRQNPDYFLGDLNSSTLKDIFESARMKEVYDRIDCTQCPPLCRNDSFNKVLYSLENKVVNKEFL